MSYDRKHALLSPFMPQQPMASTWNTGRTDGQLISSAPIVEPHATPFEACWFLLFAPFDYPFTLLFLIAHLTQISTDVVADFEIDFCKYVEIRFGFL